MEILNITFMEKGNMVLPGKVSLVGLLCMHLGSA